MDDLVIDYSPTLVSHCMSKGCSPTTREGGTHSTRWPTSRCQSSPAGRWWCGTGTCPRPKPLCSWWPGTNPRWGHCFWSARGGTTPQTLRGRREKRWVGWRYGDDRLSQGDTQLKDKVKKDVTEKIRPRDFKRRPRGVLFCHRRFHTHVCTLEMWLLRSWHLSGWP